ncbi:hypothetical protein KDL01_07565 [Actinospica durhamensis]|uniref:Uncharacterized protein n=1 Tax=Actinospica durhamensis TaxID=1508375 RepID=A0A941EKP6_9ACTN|nr:hypothetical protein [Actinospica durhamensis]MBR7833116.1 hypothetical protein [Actinospica durhamensis]
MNARISSILQWLGFAAGMAATVGAGSVLDGTGKQAATFGGILLSLAAGTALAKRDPIKSFLRRRSTLWFLFVFNLLVAVSAGFALEGAQGITAVVGMGVVSLGAAFGLVKGRGVHQHA